MAFQVGSAPRRDTLAALRPIQQQQVSESSYGCMPDWKRSGVLTEAGAAPEVLGGKLGRVGRVRLLEQVRDQVRHYDFY